MADRAEVRLSPDNELPAVCVVSGVSSSVAMGFWVRGRSLIGLLPGRRPSKWIDLPVSSSRAGIVITQRFLVAIESWLVVYFAMLTAREGADLSGAGLVLLLVGFFEVMRRLLGRRIPQVEDRGSGELLIRRAHPAFAAALGRDKPSHSGPTSGQADAHR